MSTPATPLEVRTAIATLLATVPGVGQVHNRLRLVSNDKAIQDFMVSGGTVNYWMVTNSQAAPLTMVNGSGTPGRNPSQHAGQLYRYDILGYIAFNDGNASELVLEDLVKKAVDIFEANIQLGLLPQDGYAGVSYSGPLQWAEASMVTLCGVLCHHARLTLPALTHIGM